MIEDVHASLGFEPLSGSTWRLCDLTAHEKDPSRVIAYVAQVTPGLVEAVWVQFRAGTTQHPSRDDVLREALRLARRRKGTGRSSKPSWIPHRPPPVDGPASSVRG